MIIYNCMQILYTISTLYNLNHQIYIKMGNLCQANDDKLAIKQCRHTKYKMNKLYKFIIQAQYNPKQICLECLKQREKKHHKITNRNKKQLQQLDFNKHSTIFQGDRVNNKDGDMNKISSKNKKLKDFKIIRGLGKGGYGKVFLVQLINHNNNKGQLNDKTTFQISHDQANTISTRNNILQITNNSDEIVQQLQFKIKQLSPIIPTQTKPQPSSLQVNIHPSSSSSPVTQDNDNYFALKVLNKQKIGNQYEKKQVIMQRYILQSLDHPFIIKLHYAFQTSSKLFLIVDLAHGGQLFYLLKDNCRLDERKVVFYAAELLLALQYLHSRNIIYRDLKPQNVLIGKDGHLKLTDFGLSKMIFSDNQMTYSMCGTPQYCAPEVITGNGYGKCADWFSFGSLIYDLLTGLPPFYNPNRKIMLKNITTKSVPIPQYLSPQAKSLLNSLFTLNPSQRLGFITDAQQIKKHPFFRNINFKDLQNKKIKPPIIFNYNELLVNVKGFENWQSWQDNIESLKKQKYSKHQFEGFSYQKQSSIEEEILSDSQ